MKKLNLHYRTILEEKDDYDPILDDPSQSQPPPRNPRTHELTAPRLPGWQHGPPPPHWDPWNGEGNPPYNWPRFPNGDPWPVNPPRGWPPLINPDGTYNPAGEWPPLPGHPLYDILNDFMRSYPNYFIPDERGRINWLNLPLSVRLKLFEKFRVTLWDMEGDYNPPPDLDWLKGLLFDILLFGLTRGRARGQGFIAPLAWELGTDQGMEQLINVGSSGDDPDQPPSLENPWGGSWPHQQGPEHQPPPPGWIWDPEEGEWRYENQPHPPQGVTGEFKWRLYKTRDANGTTRWVTRWEFVITPDPNNPFPISITLYWNPVTLRWERKAGVNAPSVPATVPGFGDIPDDPAGGHRLRQAY